MAAALQSRDTQRIGIYHVNAADKVKNTKRDSIGRSVRDRALKMDRYKKQLEENK